MADELPQSDIDTINEMLFRGDKIGAIKHYRLATGLGLYESKQFVEALEARLRLSSPASFHAPPRASLAGPMVVVLIVAAILGVLIVRNFFG